MAYATYTTEAIVCGSKDSYTSDRAYLLFTKDAGMLWATARSVREERSKQRPALQDFSLVRVSLVKGKSGWRIGSVESEGNVFLSADSKAVRGGISTIIKLLRRLLHGEESQPAVYEDTRRALAAVFVIGTADIAYLTDNFTLRTLAHLGYIDDASDYASLISGFDWVDTIAPLPASALRAITAGLEASHL